MDRSRSAAPALSDALDLPDLGLPTVVPLSERLESLRSVGRTQDDVTSFVEGLTLPLAEGETPRHRADLLLDVLEDEDLSGLTTPEGLPIGPAAREALLALGFPYALELTPDMLVHAQQGAPARKTMPGTTQGIALALLSGLPQGLAYLDTSNRSALGAGGLLVVPALVAALSRAMGGRLVHRLFNSLQWMVAGPFLLFLTAPLALKIGRALWMEWPGWNGGQGPRWLPTELILLGGTLLLSLGSAWSLRRGPP